MASKCVHCGGSVYGTGCSKNTNGLHQHNHDETRRIYCGATKPGMGCVHSSTKNHET